MTTLKDWTLAHKKWVEEFVLTLRAEGVPGGEIGEQLSAVHSHCDESGTFPDQEFGPAAEYAHSLGYTSGREGRPGSCFMDFFFPIGAQLTMILVTVYSIRGWIYGVDLSLNSATTFCWVCLWVCLGGVGVMSFKNVRRILRPWTVVSLDLVATVWSIAGALLAGLDLPIVVRLSPIPVAVVCIIMLLATASVPTVRILRAVHADRSDTGSASGGRWGSRRRKLDVVWLWVIPALVALDAALSGIWGV